MYSIIIYVRQTKAFNSLIVTGHSKDPITFGSNQWVGVDMPPVQKSAAVGIEWLLL